MREHGHHALRVLRRELEATRQKFTELLARLPVDPTAGQPTYAEAISGTLHALYLAANWKLQAIDLQKLWEQGPAAVPPTGRPRREQEMAIACGEVPSPPASAFPAIDAVAQQRSGVAGPSWAWDYEPCSTWPVRSANRYTGPWDHRTANQVLVIANTFDPATPVRGAVSIAEACRGRLLTVDGYSHTALINPSACANRYEVAISSARSFRPRGRDARRTGIRSTTELHHWLALVTLSDGAL